MSLCLSRRLNERICIGDEIEIVVTRIDRSQVQLAVEAPRHIRIKRKEIKDSGRSNHKHKRSD